MTEAATRRCFTGRHMATILVAFFGVVMVVNFAMAHFASSTFGGEVVENSYVASQHFNRWLDEAAQGQALGWKAEARRGTDGRIAVSLAGAPEAAVVSAIARHPLGKLPDRALTFSRYRDGHFVSGAALPEGRWRLRIEVRAAGKSWRGEQDVQ